MSVAFIQSSDDFYADKVFPTIPVTERSDDFYVYDRGDWMRIVSEKRAPGTPSAGGGYTLATDSYRAERFSIHMDVDDPTRANADDPLDPDRDATQWVTEQNMRTKEREFASKYFVTGVWNQEITPATLWDAAGSTPIEDVDAQRIRIAQLTGYRPNTMLITPPVFSALKNHADVVDRIKYTSAGVVTEQILAGLFEVDNFHVAWGISNEAAEGAADDFQFLLGKHALLCYSAPNPGIRVPSAGYTFNWTGLVGTAPEGTRIKRFRMEENESDRVEGDMSFDQKLVANDLGMLFFEVVS